MSKCTCNDKTIFEGMITEIISGKILSPSSDIEKAINIGRDDAIYIIRKYEQGRGLFQLCPIHTEPDQLITFNKCQVGTAIKWLIEIIAEISNDVHDYSHLINQLGVILIVLRRCFDHAPDTPSFPPEAAEKDSTWIK